MKTIHKYNLTFNNEQTIETHIGYQMLDVQIQNGQPVMWAKVDTDNAPITVKILMVWTGEEFPADKWAYVYLGTIAQRLVWHVFYQP